MNKETINYNIHDVLKIQLIRLKKFDLMRGFDLELSSFRVKELDDPDIVFEICKFKPSNFDCYVVDHRYYVKENYLYFKESTGKLNWEVEISGFNEGSTVVKFNYKSLGLKPYISRSSIETFLLRPIIYYKLAEKRLFLIHAAGVSNDGKAYIFPGRGGAFKTSLVMDFIKKKGFSYLGDDRIILTNNEVLNFPAHYPLFEYTFCRKNDENLSTFDKINFIICLLRNKHYKNIVPLSKSAKLNKIYFVVKSTQKYGVNIKKLTLKEAIKKLIESSKLEMRSLSDSLAGFSLGPYYKFMLAYSYVFPDSKVAKYWENLERELLKILSNIPIYEVTLPKKYNFRAFQELVHVIDGV